MLTGITFDYLSFWIGGRGTPGHDDYFDHEVAVHDLAHFTSGDGAECGAAIREAGVGASSLEEVATRIVQFLRSDLTSAELPRSRPEQSVNEEAEVGVNRAAAFGDRAAEARETGVRETADKSSLRL